MRLIALMASGVLAACLVSGCGGSQATSDCSIAVSFQMVEYREAGFSAKPTSALGSAELASCEDVGKDSPGSTFEHAESVDVLYFEGYAPSEVIGLRQSGTTRVLVATTLGSSRKEQILDALGED